jgi:hypothetical protein
MPRVVNPLAVAAGKLVLAIKKECGEVIDSAGTSTAHQVMGRATTLQHAAHNRCVQALLNGRSVVEYLDSAWVEKHSAVRPSIEIFSAELRALESE